MTTPPGSEPGWYPDPDNPRGLRKWDGSSWTERMVDSRMISQSEWERQQRMLPYTRVFFLVVFVLVLAFIGFIAYEMFFTDPFSSM